LKKGDSIISSGFSAIYPKGLLIGRIKYFQELKESSSQKIVLTPAANFHNVEFGYAIENTQQQEINKLLQNTKQKIN